MKIEALVYAINLTNPWIFNMLLQLFWALDIFMIASIFNEKYLKTTIMAFIKMLRLI